MDSFSFGVSVHNCANKALTHYFINHLINNAWASLMWKHIYYVLLKSDTLPAVKDQTTH